MICIAFLCIFCACDKEEENNLTTVPGNLTYNGQNYKVTGMLFHNHGWYSEYVDGNYQTMDNVASISVRFYTGDWYYDEHENYLFTNGKGLEFEIAIFTTDPDAIPAGTYPFVPMEKWTNNLPSAYTIIGDCDEIYSILEFIEEDWSLDDYVSLASGTLKVANTDNTTYTFDFTGKLENGETITLNYTGAPDFIRKYNNYWLTN